MMRRRKTPEIKRGRQTKGGELTPSKIKALQTALENARKIAKQLVESAKLKPELLEKLNKEFLRPEDLRSKDKIKGLKKLLENPNLTDSERKLIEKLIELRKRSNELVISARVILPGWTHIGNKRK